MLCLARILLSQPCFLGVRYECNQGGFFVGLGGLFCGFKGLSYLLRAVSNILQNGGEKFRFLSKETWSQCALALCIMEARTDCSFAGW